MKNFLFKLRMPMMLIFSGLATAIPLLFPKLGFFQWLSLIPMAMVLITLAEDSKLRPFRAYGLGLIFYMSYYSVIYHWFLYMYPLDFAGLSPAISVVVVLLGCFGIAFVQAIFSALGFVLFTLTARSGIVRRHPIFMPFIMAAIWVVAEWWQTIGWWGMPWGKLAIGQVTFSLLVKSAAVIGPYFISFVIVAFSFLMAIAIMKKTQRRGIAAAVAISLFCLNLAMGTVVSLSYNEEEGRVIRVAAAQGNVPSGEKWQGGYPELLKMYGEMTAQAAAEGAEIIVWPETAFPCDLSVRTDIADEIKKIAIENDITILVSAFTTDSESGMQYNSLYEVSSKGEFGKDVYNKQKLVPFGEFVPMRDLVVAIFPPLADINMLESDLKAGEEGVIINGEQGKIGCGICFDSAYESVVLDAVNNGAELIALSTNYSWFKDSRALNMHNAHSQLRAIESGRYLICSSNTGISSVIDPMGNVIDEVGVLERGYAVADVHLRSSATPYSVIGNSFVYLCMSFAFGLPIAAIIVDTKAKKDSDGE